MLVPSSRARKKAISMDEYQHTEINLFASSASKFLQQAIQWECPPSPEVPVNTLATVPFLWEDAPGKPKPQKSHPSHTTLPPPPRLVAMKPDDPFMEGNPRLPRSSSHGALNHILHHQQQRKALSQEENRINDCHNPIISSSSSISPRSAFTANSSSISASPEHATPYRDSGGSNFTRRSGSTGRSLKNFTGNLFHKMRSPSAKYRQQRRTFKEEKDFVPACWRWPATQNPQKTARDSKGAVGRGEEVAVR